MDWLNLEHVAQLLKDIISSVLTVNFKIFPPSYTQRGDRGSIVVKVLCYNSEGRWFDPSWCQWIFH